MKSAESDNSSGRGQLPMDVFLGTTEELHTYLLENKLNPGVTIRDTHTVLKGTDGEVITDTPDKAIKLWCFVVASHADLDRSDI